MKRNELRDEIVSNELFKNHDYLVHINNCNIPKN